MSITTSLSEKISEKKDLLVWNLKYNSIGNALWMPYWMMLRRERGTEFPYYFPEETRHLVNGVHTMTERIDDFINCHEMEKNRDGDFEKTLTERMKWVLKNFHIYSNDTMSNLYFTAQLPKADYQRLKNTYNQLSLLFLAYNSFTGIFLISINNFAFRSRRVSIPMVAAASVTTMLALTCNYHLSYFLFDKCINFSARRLGYAELLHPYNTHYKRNLEFTSY
jgi:hypothetical protein